MSIIKTLEDANLTIDEINFVCWLYNNPSNTGGLWADENNYWFIVGTYAKEILKKFIQHPYGVKRSKIKQMRMFAKVILKEIIDCGI